VAVSLAGTTPFDVARKISLASSIFGKQSVDGRQVTSM
jgi:hypothetical protein